MSWKTIHAFSIIRFQLSGTTCLPLGCHVQQLSMGVFELNKIERSSIDHSRKEQPDVQIWWVNKSHSINFSGKIYGNRQDLRSRWKFITKSITKMHVPLFLFHYFSTAKRNVYVVFTSRVYLIGLEIHWSHNRGNSKYDRDGNSVSG